MTDGSRGPRVGIWWDDGRRLVIVSIPADAVGVACGVIDGPFNHADEWTAHVARFGLAPDTEYFTVPRGRVIVGSDGVAVILHGPATTSPRLERIARRFHLDRWRSQIDEHYFTGSDADELFREEDDDPVDVGEKRTSGTQKKRKEPRNHGPKQSVPKRADRDRRVRQSERIARVLTVLNLIQSRGQWNAGSIAEELGCSQRTVYRDLDVLELAGVPYYYDAEAQSYRVQSDYRFPTLALTEGEAFGQAAAGVLADQSGFEALRGITETNRKLSATSSERIRNLMADASRVVAVLNLQIAGDHRSSEIIEIIRTALLTRRVLTGSYSSPYEEKPVRLRLHPYRLCYVKKAWYLVGRIEEESEPRTFRVVRFRTLQIADGPSQMPEDFDLKTYFGNAWAVYRNGQCHEVELRFEPPASKVVTETVWHHTQRVKRHRDGSVTLTFEVDGLGEIANWILSWSGRVRVVRPAELRGKIVTTLHAAIDLNAG